MVLLVRLVVVCLVIGGAGAASYKPFVKYWKTRNLPTYRLAEVQRGRVVSVVNSTGEVKPVLSVAVGSFVSGPITELHVDFNDRVRKDQLLAKIDPRIYLAAVERDKAALATRLADVERVKAQWQQAANDERRATDLQAENADYISQAEIDKFHFACSSLTAQIKVAKASVAQAQANLENSEANLAYTKISSPVDGIVIDRKIDPGQTLAAAFQTPELFVIAPDMDKKMHIFASVDEADMGLIRRARDAGNTVSFTVDAYPDDLFEGTIEQIRFSSTNTQNVVTYPVVVAAPNPELKLMPGMTANLSFRIEEKDDILLIPNAALRYYPDETLVRDGDNSDQHKQSAMQQTESARKRSRRHVWVTDGNALRAFEVVTGINDNRYTELVSGNLTEHEKLVTGIQPKK